MNPNELSQEQLSQIVTNIKMTPVISSNIVALGYDKENKILRVIFKGNSSYLYFNVEEEIYNNLAQSESKGRTLNESVVRHKDKYKYIKI